MRKFVTSTEAAQRLGVSQRQVQSLLLAGRLSRCGSVGRTVAIEHDSLLRVENLLGGLGRPWSAKTAWTCLALLSGQSLTTAERNLAAKRLTQVDREELFAKCRRRARVRTFRGSMTAQKMVRETLPATSAHALMEPETGQRFGANFTLHGADAYVTSDVADELICSLNLSEDPEGSITLRIVEDARFLSAGTPDAAIALDLIDCADPRARAAGQRVLDDLCEQLAARNAVSA